MLHYFAQLPKRNYLTTDELVNTAYYAFSPFYQYLQTSIKASEDRAEIKAKWKKVKQDNLVELQIIGGLYEIPKTTKIKLLNVEKGVYTIIGIKD
ncbi:MAG: hypothetical protein JXL97_03620 [Bacteroidales bacterium]|nr:hypothetical protein [Bacteroidales bacterium]